MHDCVTPKAQKKQGKNNNKNNEKNKKDDSKKNRQACQNPAFQRVGPKIRQSPGGQTPQKTKQKKRPKNTKPPKKTIQKKFAGSAKTLRFKRVGPKFCRSPGGQKPQKGNQKKHKIFQKFLKVFGSFLFLSLRQLLALRASEKTGPRTTPGPYDDNDDCMATCLVAAK